MRKKLTILITAIVLFTLNTTAARADNRVATLRKFLASHNSPLTNFSETFVVEADKNGLDWRLLPAISGVESTFGKRIPYNSFNAYGWAGGEYRFISWSSSIAIVAKSLKENYRDRGLISVNQIGRAYCPPNSAWATKVKYFMAKIDPIPLSFTI